MDSAPESPAGQTPPHWQTVESGPPSIPDHELSHRIGSGRYGEGWLARNLATGALRAVKIVYRSTLADERPFNREFELDEDQRVEIDPQPITGRSIRQPVPFPGRLPA